MTLRVKGYAFTVSARLPLRSQHRRYQYRRSRRGHDRTYCRVVLTDTDFTEPTFDVW
jgi:hypothetical protein